MQAVDFGRTEPELLEDLAIVFTEIRSTPRRRLFYPMHLNGTADRRGQLAACSFERNDDVIGPQLRIVDDFLGPAQAPKVT